jgi:hypothetical protein
MKIHFDTSSLKRTKWHEYAIRFILGGSITAIAGVTAAKFGPVIGGLLLAFPAIFPASATLIEKHENEKKQRAGLKPGHRGTDAAALDAAGAAMGSMGMLVFALVLWKVLVGHQAGVVLALATFLWLGVSILIWNVCELV